MSLFYDLCISYTFLFVLSLSSCLWFLICWLVSWVIVSSSYPYKCCLGFLSLCWLIVLWYHSHSIKEFCCALWVLFLFSFIALIFFLKTFLWFFFAVMAEERPASSSQADPTNNYLYLHPSENPVASLVLSVLDASNYHSWNRLILTTLNAKNKV